ncbi:hypothetical protein [Kocuria sp. U4B]
MRTTVPVLALLGLALTGCDDPGGAGEDSSPASSAPVSVSPSPTMSPTPTTEPSEVETGSAAPAPDVPGPERSPGGG